MTIPLLLSLFTCIRNDPYSWLLSTYPYVINDSTEVKFKTELNSFLVVIYELQLYLKIQSVPRSKHSVSVTNTNDFMLYKEIIAVCSEMHTKHINTMCGQNVELYRKIQSVPRSKHTPSQLYKPVS